MDLVARLLVVASLFVGGCTDLSSFRTEGAERYEGVVMGLDDRVECAVEGCSEFRRGFTAGTVLSMAFDPTLAGTAPGTLRTTGQTCGVEVLDDVPMLPIPALTNDQLALYEFPGGGRLFNYVFAVAPETGPLAGRDMVAFVSLLRDGSVEVRLLSGAGLDECGPDDCARFADGDCDFFGVFHLSRPESDS